MKETGTSFASHFLKKPGCKQKGKREYLGAEDVNRQLVHLLQDAIKVEDFRNITRLRDA